MVISGLAGARNPPCKTYDLGPNPSKPAMLDCEGTASAESGTEPRPPLNALSVDVEDWAQASLDPTLPLTDRFYRNTHRVLETCAAHGVKATFFVLGLAAEKCPRLVNEIQSAGHEVQCHGYGHRLIFNQSPVQFRADIERAKKLLEDLIGETVTGYRAPAFSITRNTLWALDVLVECGFRYDSSIFPVYMWRYGMARVPRFPHRLKTPCGAELIEIPVATLRLGRCTLPIGGGGYYRFLPYRRIRMGVRQMNAAGVPATVYLHPHEFDPEELRELPFAIPRFQRILKGWGRRSVPRKVKALLTEFAFGRIDQMIASLGPLIRHSC